MKRWILLAVALACASCREPAVPATLDRPFDLPRGRVALVTGADLRLEFLRISSDSRCPMNATCIWMGEATVALEVQRGSESPESIVARLPGRVIAPDSIAWTRWRDVRIGLARLLPYPTAGVPVDSSTYVATLVVRRP